LSTDLKGLKSIGTRSNKGWLTDVAVYQAGGMWGFLRDQELSGIKKYLFQSFIVLF